MRIISIEANIGAGKTSLLERLETRYADRDDVLFLFEPVGVWESVCDKDGVNMLKKYYADPKRWGFAFQVLAFNNRRDELKQAIEDAKLLGSKIRTIITERSLLSDRFIFARMLCDTECMDMCEAQIYEMMADSANVVAIDGVLWLTVPPDTCLDRINKRRRAGEENITLDYLETIDVYHRQWLESQEYWNPEFVLRLDDSNSTNQEYWKRMDDFILKVYGQGERESQPNP